MRSVTPWGRRRAGAVARVPHLLTSLTAGHGLTVAKEGIGQIVATTQDKE